MDMGTVAAINPFAAVGLMFSEGIANLSLWPHENVCSLSW